MLANLGPVQPAAVERVRPHTTCCAIRAHRPTNLVLRALKSGAPGATPRCEPLVAPAPTCAACGADAAGGRAAREDDEIPRRRGRQGQGLSVWPLSPHLTCGVPRRVTGQLTDRTQKRPCWKADYFR
eukprot:7386741-Prymnesium_polylepis.2